MAILTVALLATFNPGSQIKRGRDGTRKGDLSQIRIALETYRADKASYPTTASFPACGNAFTFGGSTYMQKVPCDPRNTGQYIYVYTSITGTTYTLTACLENINDSQKDPANNASICTGGTTNWSYTLQNP